MIKVTNDLTNWLNKIQNFDKRQFLESMGQEHIKIIRKRLINSKSGPDGTAWAPWAESTLAARTKAGTAGRGLLYDSGNLLNSLRYDVKGNTVEIITDVPYAKYLQEGTDNMPARPFMGFGPKDSERTKVIWKRILKNGTN